MSSETTGSTPGISIIVASKVGSPFIDQCLNSLASEAAELGAEVIVVAAGDLSYAERIAAAFPWTKVIHAADLLKVPALRRRGVDEARGEIVAIIEEHCSAAPDWLHRALAGHLMGRYGAVGGPIVDYNYSRLRDWVVYFLEYNGALPPYPKGETFDLNDANIAYRRDILVSHRNLLDDGYWPMTMHPTLIAKGIKLLSLPDMIVYHRGPFNFGYYLHQRYLFSRALRGRAGRHTIGGPACRLSGRGAAHANHPSGPHYESGGPEAMPHWKVCRDASAHDSSPDRLCRR